MPSDMLFRSACLNPFVIAVVAGAFTVVCAAPAKVDESVEVDNEPSSSSSNSRSRDDFQESSNEYANWGQPYFFASLVFFACAIAWAIFDSRRQRKKRSIDDDDATVDIETRNNLKKRGRATSKTKRTRTKNRARRGSDGNNDDNGADDDDDDDDEEEETEVVVHNDDQVHGRGSHGRGAHHDNGAEGNRLDAQMLGADDAYDPNARNIHSSQERRHGHLIAERGGGVDPRDHQDVRDMGIHGMTANPRTASRHFEPVNSPLDTNNNQRADVQHPGSLAGHHENKANKADRKKRKKRKKKLSDSSPVSRGRRKTREDDEEYWQSLQEAAAHHKATRGGSRPASETSPEGQGVRAQDFAGNTAGRHPGLKHHHQESGKRRSPSQKNTTESCHTYTPNYNLATNF